MLEVEMRLEGIYVRGLLKHFNYPIALHVEDRVTIIHGPNGFGKTTLLKLINAFYRGDYDLLEATTFDSLELVFEGDIRMLVKREISTGVDSDAQGTEKFAENGGHPQITCELYAGKSLLHSDCIKRRRVASRLRDTLQHQFPYWVQIGTHTWQDQRDGEILEERELIARYEGRVASNLKHRQATEPSWLKEHKDQFRVRFIPSQRLLIELAPRSAHSRASAEASNFQFTVDAYARELAGMIERKVAEYGALTARYERSFPDRFVSQDDTIDLVRAMQLRTDIESRLEEIEKKRARLQASGLLDKQVDHQLALTPNFSDAKLVFLDLYTRDVQTKLEIFDELASKIGLFTEILNRKFSHKRLSISRQRGFVIDVDGVGDLRPQDLSSGEQHELVLCFELLFKTESGYFVMIDEPEISLHVEWQETFLDDLQKIAELAKFDSLIATHSPIIVGRRWDLTANLAQLSEPVSA